MTEHDRHAEPGVQHLAGGDRRPHELGVPRDVGDVDGLSTEPDAPRQPDPGQERALAAGRLEFRDIDPRGVPDLHAPQYPGFPVDAPQRAHVPAQAFPHRLEDLRGRLFERRHRRQDLGDRVLGEEPLLGELALGDVLERSEQAARLARLVGQHVALAADEAHLAAGPDDAVLDVVPPAAPERLRDRRGPPLAVGRVDPLLDVAGAEGALLRGQPEDAIGLVRPRVTIGGEITLPVTDARHPLGLLQPALALAEVAEAQHARQRVLQPAADLLEEPLLGRRPAARERALVDTEHVRPVALGMDRHGDHGLDAEASRRLLRQRVVRAGTESHGARGRPHQRHGGRALRVRGDLRAEREGPRELGAGVFHHHVPRGGVRIAGIHEPRAIAPEEGQDRLQHMAHHLLEVSGALDGPVDSIHALQEPEACLLGSPALDRDAGQRRDPVDHRLLARRGVAGLAGVDGDGAQHASVGGAHRRRPARAEVVPQGEVSPGHPPRIVGDVGDDHRLVAMGRRTAGAGDGTDGHAVDPVDVAPREARRGAVPQATTVGIQQQDRGE